MMHLNFVDEATYGYCIKQVGYGPWKYAKCHISYAESTVHDYKVKYKVPATLSIDKIIL